MVNFSIKYFEDFVRGFRRFYLQFAEKHLIDLLGSSLNVSNKIGTFVGLLQTSEHHLGSGDVFLWVLEVLEKSIFVPGDSLLDVGVRVRESGSLASLASNDSAQVGSDLVLTTSFDGVALSATLNEQLLSLFDITSWNTHD